MGDRWDAFSGWVKENWRPIVAIAASVVTAGALTGWSMAYISVGQAMAVGMASGAVSGAIMTGSLRGAFEGAIFGAFSAGMAWSIGSMGITNTLAKASLHGISQGGLGMARGGTFRSGFMSGFMSSAVSVDNVRGGLVGRTVAAGIVGGTASELGGGKFANGAMTGAFVHLFNSEAHRYQTRKIYEMRHERYEPRPLGEWESEFSLGAGNVKVPGTNLNVKLPLNAEIVSRPIGEFDVSRQYEADALISTGDVVGQWGPTTVTTSKFTGVKLSNEYGIRGCIATCADGWVTPAQPFFTWTPGQ